MDGMNIADQSFPAHIREDGSQSCIDHCMGASRYAKEDLNTVNLGNTAYLAGILHDCGKFTKEFSEYISKAASGEKVRKGSVIHSFAGVYYLLKKYHNNEEKDPYQIFTAELAAYAVGAHHGLFDCVSEDHESGFEYRLLKQPEYEKRAIKNFVTCFDDKKELEEIFQAACQETTRAINKIQNIVDFSDAGLSNREIFFYFGLLGRLLCSAVIDGDRRDTAEFMNHEDFSKYIQATDEMWKQCSEHLEEMINAFPMNTSIQRARREISDICLAFSNEPTGIYRLNVPTGGGKTLSSLRYALTHAEKYGKKRIIYTAPLISILDQNAAVIRQAIKDDDLILEHHSNIIRDNEADAEDVLKYEFLTDTWDSPIVITTLVQLLNTFFSGKTASVRRFQSICDSIIIIDEVQTVPDHMLSLFNLTLNFINKICNATIVLCSATQPCLEEIPHRLNTSEKMFISRDDYKKFSKVFKRTELIDKGNYRFDDLPDLIHECMEEVGSLLVICNTKREAAVLFEQTKKAHKNCFHLSASMCMAHRKDVLQSIYTSLKLGEETICIATQVIEAGVDISFERVIRLTAGIDSIVQAAGRCNRNGEIPGAAEVYIVRCVDEKLGNLKEIQSAQNAANNLLAGFQADPKRFEEDLASDASVNYYYRSLYNSFSDTHYDYPVKGKPSLMELLSDNSSYSDGCKGIGRYTMRQAFKTAGKLFKALDQDSESVIVPYGNGGDLITEICSGRAAHDIGYLKSLLEQAKEYTVSIYRNQFIKMQQAGAFYFACDGTVILLNEGWYYSSTGVQEEPGREEDNECNILIL